MEQKRIVAGFHLIWTAYGWWLPNDPRGSMSHEIRVEKVAELGERHYGRKAVQPPGREIREFYDEARDLLAHPLLTFSDNDIELIGESFGRVITDRRYTCYACAILPDHVHAVIRKHRDHAEDMIENLQTASRSKLIEAGSRAITHPVWGGPGWKVFLYSIEDFVSRIKYVRMNPIKAGRPERHWSFVKEYDGWLPHWYRRT